MNNTPDLQTADLEYLAGWWMEQKEIERRATETRRAIEDRICELAAISTALEGTQNVDAGAYVAKIVGRLDHKIDADRVQEIANEAGISNLLSTLFRWKPEINMTIWKATDAKITGILAPAITTKPGRPSFSITKAKE